MVYDNIFTFRHIRYPNVVLQNPKHIVSFLNITRGSTYTYGCNILPSLREIRDVILAKRVFENEGETLDFSEFNLTNYQVFIDGKKQSFINIYEQQQ